MRQFQAGAEWHLHEVRYVRKYNWPDILTFLVVAHAATGCSAGKVRPPIGRPLLSYKSENPADDGGVFVCSTAVLSVANQTSPLGGGSKLEGVGVTITTPPDGAIAGQRGRHFMVVKKELHEDGVEPVFNPRKIGATVYRRAEALRAECLLPPF